METTVALTDGSETEDDQQHMIAMMMPHLVREKQNQHFTFFAQSREMAHVIARVLPRVLRAYAAAAPARPLAVAAQCLCMSGDVRPRAWQALTTTLAGMFSTQ